MFEKCEFCEKYDFWNFWFDWENWNWGEAWKFVKTLKIKRKTFGLTEKIETDEKSRQIAENKQIFVLTEKLKWMKKTRPIAKNKQTFGLTAFDRKNWNEWKNSSKLWNCEFCQMWDFKNVHFVKNETLNCEFCPK